MNQLTFDYLGTEVISRWLRHDCGLKLAPAAGAEEEQLADTLIVGGGEPLAERASNGYAAVIRVLADGSPSGPLSGKPELLVVRGPHERAQLGSAIEMARRLVLAADLQRTVSSPYSHDVRGSLGVLGLSTQVLKASGASESVVRKLEACAIRLESHLADLPALVQAHLRNRAIPSPDSNATWRSLVEALSRWFEVAHRGIELETHPTPWPMGSAPAGLLVVLRSLLDALAHYSQRGASVVLELDATDSARQVLVSRTTARDITDEQLERLLLPVSRWASHGACAVPYRLRLCALWAEAHGAQLRLEKQGAGLEVQLTC